MLLHGAVFLGITLGKMEDGLMASSPPVVHLSSLYHWSRGIFDIPPSSELRKRIASWLIDRLNTI